ECGLLAAADVVTLPRAPFSLEDRDESSDHISDVYEVPELISIAVDDRRQVFAQPLDELADDSPVLAAALPRTVNVEESQASGIEPVASGEGLAVPLARQLARGIR